jgi:hypothetical protein
VHAVALFSPCAHHVPHYTAHVAGWTWYATSMALAAGEHCDDNDAQPDSLSHVLHSRSKKIALQGAGVQVPSICAWSPGFLLVFI